MACFDQAIESKSDWASQAFPLYTLVHKLLMAEFYKDGLVF